MTDKYDLELLMQGHAPILYIESHEETRAKGLLVSIATKLIIPIFQWSATEGLSRLDIDLGIQHHNKQPQDVLSHIKTVNKEGIYVLLDFEPYLENPVNTRFIKEIAMRFDGTKSKLVLLSHNFKIPGSPKAGRTYATT